MSIANILVPNNYDLYFGSITVPDLSVDNLTVTANETVGGNLTVTGNYTSTSGNITLTNGDLSVGDDITVGGDIAVTGNYTSTNGNITLTNGDLVVANGDASCVNLTVANDIICTGQASTINVLTHPTVTNINSSSTLTAAQTVGGIINVTGGTVTLTFPDAADVLTLLGGVIVNAGVTFTLLVSNDSGNNTTMAPGSNFTIANNATINVSDGFSRLFYCVINGNAIVAY